MFTQRSWAERTAPLWSSLSWLVKVGRVTKNIFSVLLYERGKERRVTDHRSITVTTVGIQSWHISLTAALNIKPQSFNFCTNIYSQHLSWASVKIIAFMYYETHRIKYIVLSIKANWTAVFSNQTVKHKSKTVSSRFIARVQFVSLLLFLLHLCLFSSKQPSPRPSTLHHHQPTGPCSCC